MTTQVVAALIWRGEQFMICQRPAHKARGLLWEFAGGKVEPGETRQQALVRECREELGVEIAVGDVFMEVTHISGHYRTPDPVSCVHHAGRAAEAGASGHPLDSPRGHPPVCVLPGRRGHSAKTAQRRGTKGAVVAPAYGPL